MKDKQKAPDLERGGDMRHIIRRPIKFRVWDHEAKHFVIPWRGSYYDDFDLIYTNEGKWFWSGGDKIDIERYSMVQSTGLLDKNGCEIYEGDILASDCNEKPCNYIVKWSENKADYCGFVLNPVMKNPPRITYHMHNFKMWMAEGFLVIGNVFENPELLVPK